MYKAVSSAVVMLVFSVVPFTSLAGMPSDDDPLSPFEPPIGSEIGYDEMVGRASATSPSFSIMMGNADWGPGLKTTVINGATDTVVFQSGGSPAQSFSFTSIAQEVFPGDLTAQADFISTLDDLATDRTLMTSFENYSYRSGVSFDDEPIIEYQCAFIPCRRVIDRADPANYHWQSTLVPDWNEMNVGQNPFPDDNYPGYTASEVQIDRANFERRRQDACQEITDLAAEIFATGVLTGGSCLYADNIGGAIGCAAGLTQTAFLNRRSSRLERTCHAVYRGPGTW